LARIEVEIIESTLAGSTGNHLVRVKVPSAEDGSGQLVAPPQHHLPLGDVEHNSIVRLARDRLRPMAAPDPAPPQAARSRADHHAAIVHQLDRRPTGPRLSM
jgi:hypothetical protein